MILRDTAITLGLDNSMLDAPQLGFLFDLAYQAPPGPSAEIGVYHGGSLVCWAQARVRMPGHDLIYAIDPFGPESKWRRAEAVFVKNMIDAGLWDRIIPVKDEGWEAARQTPDNLAFLFIDGDHSLTGIPRDIVVWPQKITPGGIIAFHDYISSKATAVVGCCVDAWQAEARWIDLGLVGSAKAFQRPIE